MLTTGDKSYKGKKLSLIRRLKNKLFYLLRITRVPVVKVYNGYGHKEKVMIFGHVLRQSPLPRKRYRPNVLLNTFALLRLFMVRPYAKAKVKLQWHDQICETHTEDDGFFRFEWHPGESITHGWHTVKIHLVDPLNTNEILASGEGQIFIPHVHQYACISDIDDTFLISHSSNIRKRLYVLLTKNAHSRKPFEGVVNHYKLLAKAGATSDADNPFFYVSSSEWNLYNFIKDFSKKNELPDGIYLLSQIKQLKEFWKTGQNKHKTKFMRIARIIESYPQQKYILLGDDSQEDPNIYSAIAEHFPGNIHCIYLRRVSKKKEESVKKTIQKLKEARIPCCYFSHSSEAIIHSKEIGLIPSI